MTGSSGSSTELYNTVREDFFEGKATLASCKKSQIFRIYSCKLVKMGNLAGLGFRICENSIIRGTKFANSLFQEFGGNKHSQNSQFRKFPRKNFHEFRSKRRSK